MIIKKLILLLLSTCKAFKCTNKIKERTSIRVASTKTLKSNSIMGYFGVTSYIKFRIVTLHSNFYLYAFLFLSVHHTWQISHIWIMKFIIIYNWCALLSLHKGEMWWYNSIYITRTVEIYKIGLNPWLGG